ncbi:putative F-box protein At1g47790 [Bidens hawaiensis]|uniref:putative F-box protein At1g47790 n=1 Tax=Bidens hawaiensis TaxID=980011 RepID=UPI00404B191D
MSANIPLDIQIEIIKRLLPVKSLIRFRTVSKQWKSLIDSSTFIADHSVNQAQPHHLLITYKDVSSYQEKYVSIVDDDSFPLYKFSPTVPPTVKLASYTLMLDCSHGLVCLHSFDMDRKTLILVMWNPSIRKSIGIMLPYEFNAIGFGVCPKTSDVKIVKMTRDSGNWLAEVLTLSSRAWRSVSWNLPYKSLEFTYSQVVIIDGVIHWQAYDTATRNYRIISFDLTSEEFGEVDLPDALARPRKVLGPSIYKLDESLAVLNYREDDAGKGACDVWKILKNGGPKSSFTKLFTVTLKLEDGRIIGFRKNGQPIIRQWYRRGDICRRELEVYDPRSERIIDLGIYGSALSMASYTESLLLLNYPDSVILS